MTRWIQVALVFGTLTLAVPLFADHGQGKAKGNRHGNQAANEGDDRGDNDRWEKRGDYEYRTYGEHDGVPPGWSKGKKTGWGNCGMPPGQAKKYGCQSYRYQGRDYYYYRDQVGHIVVRRPSIHIEGGGIDIH
jgi:hypothetical protein